MARCFNKGWSVLSSAEYAHFIKLILAILLTSLALAKGISLQIPDCREVEVPLLIRLTNSANITRIQAFIHIFRYTYVTRVKFQIKKFLEELISSLPLIRHGPHSKGCVEQFFYAACVSFGAVTLILSRCLAMIEGYTHKLRQMGGILEVRRWDWLTCHDVHTKFHKDWFMHSRGIHKYRDDGLSLLSFFRSKDIRLKIRFIVFFIMSCNSVPNTKIRSLTHVCWKVM